LDATHSERITDCPYPSSGWRHEAIFRLQCRKTVIDSLSSYRGAAMAKMREIPVNDVTTKASGARTAA
jgi:hypothetical protein